MGQIRIRREKNENHAFYLGHGIFSNIMEYSNNVTESVSMNVI